MPEGQPGVPVTRAATVVETRVTTGRPYSAEATTEFVQVLGDGNKIARKSTVRVYRDSDGRTRREELGTDGTVRAVSIYDPVAHLSYVLDPATRTARKSAMRIAYPASAATLSDEDKKRIEARKATDRGSVGAGTITLVAPAEAPSQAIAEELRKRQQAEMVVAGAGGRGRGVQTLRVAQDAKEESLGQKVVEGVVADGKRVTTVLPAGAIGNQQPITVLTEQWFSPDLEILLMTRHSDPRSGDTTYTVTNIVRAEPQASLFDVPADYAILESPYKAPAR
jgi:nucleotide-binding universal stress UspA family protein